MTIDISNWVEIAPGIFAAPNAGATFGGDVGQTIQQTVDSAIASGAQTAGQYYGSGAGQNVTLQGANIDSYNQQATTSSALASARTSARRAQARIAERGRRLRNEVEANQSVRRSLRVLGTASGSTSGASITRATKAKKKKGRTRSNVRLGSVQSSPGSSLNISI